MSLVRYPRTSWGIRIVSLLAALVVAAFLVHLVLNFGWYASGLAFEKEEARRRREEPIRLNFSDPNAADPNAGGTPVPDPNAADPNRP
jgi:hypothetical protein